MKTYVLLGGWARDERSYTKLLQTKPTNSQFTVLHHADLDIHQKENGFNIDIVRFLEKKGLDKIVLIGNSLGGALAISFAAHHPEKVEKLILVDSAGIPTNDTPVSMAKKVLTTQTRSYARKKLEENTRSMLLALSRPVTYTKAGMFAYTVDVRKDAKNIRIPTTIIWGGNDVMFPVSFGDQLHKMIKHSTFLVLPDMDHDWPLHNPQAFWENVE